MNVYTVAERPDLSEPAWEAVRDTFPEYNNHGDVLNAHWDRLTEERPEFQFHVVGDDERILARARCLPVPGGLAPLTVADGAGRYWEPNVWMRHPIA